MLILKGKTLGERQKELNLKVNDAAANKIPFEQVKDDAEGSDIDRFFKIDLASKYKNIYYMLDVLKCGDSLYISRALKCLWMYEDEYDFFISAAYLQENVFPFMSLRMKRKALSAIANNVTNEDRAELFYKYCMKIKFKNNAYKFLVHTSETFKLSVNEKQVMSDKTCNRRHIIGKSFPLAEAYLEQTSGNETHALLREISYMYYVSNEKYLKFIENYVTGPEAIRLGFRVSKNILKKHRTRVLNNLSVYLSVLNKNALVTCSSTGDVKLYIEKLMPPYVNIFWDKDFCSKYKRFIEALPAEDRFPFLQKLFNKAYPGEEFEMSRNFYDLDCNKIMTTEQQERWALQHLSSKTEVLGAGQDFYWYVFINFRESFREIRKFYMTDEYKADRNTIFEILIDIAKDDDIENLLEYYCEYHMNKESIENREHFLTYVIEHHNVFQFKDSGWYIFETILHSLDAYNKINCSDRNYVIYRTIGLIHYISYGKDLPDGLEQYIRSGRHCYISCLKYYSSKLVSEQEEKVFQYMLQFYVDQLNKCEGEIDDYESNTRNSVCKILDLLHNYSKSKDDCPDIAMKYVQANWDVYKNADIFREEEEPFTQEHLIRDLKTDATAVVDKLPLLKKNIYTIAFYKFELNKFLNKLNTYFSYDIAKPYRDFFIEMLSVEVDYGKIINEAVNGIFILADENFINDFMVKYIPEKEEVTTDDYDANLLFIRVSICLFSCQSRPPILMNFHNFLKYVKGKHYISFCTAAFYMYVSNLPLNMAVTFIQELLKKSFPVQQHAIWLALTCYSSEEINNLVMDIWNDPGKESLRVTLYKALHNLVKRDKVENEVVHLLNAITCSLQENDPEDIFKLLTAEGFSKTHIGDYLANASSCVDQLPDDDKNIQRKICVIDAITKNVNYVAKHLIKSIIDEHVKKMLIEKQILIECQSSEIDKLNKRKWELVAAYIVMNDDKEIVENNVILVKQILEVCIKMWNEVLVDVYVLRHFCSEFVVFLQDCNCNYKTKDYQVVNKIFEVIVKKLSVNVPAHETFLLLWSLRLTIITNNVIDEASTYDKHRCVLTEYCHKLGKEIGRLIFNEYNGKLYGSVLSEVKLEVNKQLQRLFNNQLVYRACDTVLDDVKIFVSEGLLEYNMNETYQLAAMVLPNVIPYRHKREFINVLCKLQSIGAMSIQCYLNIKFRNLNFKNTGILLNSKVRNKSSFKWTWKKILFIVVFCVIVYGLFAELASCFPHTSPKLCLA